MKFLKIGLVTAVLTSATMFVAPALADDAPSDPKPFCYETGYNQVTDWTRDPNPPEGDGWVLDQDRDVVVEEAYDEVIEGTPSQWWSWSPNKEQGPFDGPPAFPSDPRGTWNGPKTEGGPDGEGTFQNGNGHGSWFHREPGTPDKVIHHDEVTVKEYTYARFILTGTVCPENPPLPPVDVTPPPVVVTPPQDSPKDTTKETKCKPKKCVVITTDSTGKVVDKYEIVYGNVDEEGF